ncbi:contractile injection system tape measure protein [Flavobacterium sp. LS1R49]|uniref:Contractile injection system tape measure protein n=1 Tax=Flavobacterium shii TaxID=2987687 RepID=A0A9X3BZJ7_9FLAO|nr:contractile injection system tape measure protein [Flavobacterium shii]MCV9930370.1 contractile injection system tape measure protein [Flavobacterium shii]
MARNLHSIQRVLFEIDTHSMLMANSFKNSLAVFLQDEVVPVLEKQFDLIESIGNKIVQIEKLEISIQSNTWENDSIFSKNDIKNQIEKEIQKALNELQKTTTNKEEKESKIETISPEDKELKTLLYFIENGSMPWWVSKEDEIDFFKKINFENLKNDVFKIQFRNLIQQKKVQKRIIDQFANKEIVLFTSVLLDSEAQQKMLSKTPLLQLLNKKSYEFKSLFWQLIFDVSNEKKPMDLVFFYHQKRAEFSSVKMSFELFIQNLKAFFPLNASADELTKMNDNYLNSEKVKSAVKPESTIENPKIEAEKINSESCYVQNAGLIILHPFFKELLKSCGLMGDSNTLLNKELAAHILHYAATKRENDYEHTMLFEKFLCGIPLHQSIQREVKIEELHKQQVEEMLASALLHWSALKNTSTGVLRSEFLQREGKLDWSESNPKLTIERKTQDLLLEKIPWNITIVKIPWIEKLIYTQW